VAAGSPAFCFGSEAPRYPGVSERLRVRAPLPSGELP
jgi:hypothetical protein